MLLLHYNLALAINTYLKLKEKNIVEEKRAKMAKVTKKEIVAVARKIDIDTIFLLEGVVNEGN